MREQYAPFEQELGQRWVGLIKYSYPLTSGYKGVPFGLEVEPGRIVVAREIIVEGNPKVELAYDPDAILEHAVTQANFGREILKKGNRQQIPLWIANCAFPDTRGAYKATVNSRR